jgi:lipoprotein-anchoring transpeptidase ErfK/SrfK
VIARSAIRRGLVLAAGVGAVALVAAACSSGSTRGALAPDVTSSGASSTASSTTPAPTTSAATTSSAPATHSSTPTTPKPKPKPTPTKASPNAAPVHVSLLESDGSDYGVGMPIIAWFDVAPTSAVAFAKATTVTANGKPIQGGWYFEPTAHTGSALEAHWRPKTYWPAHSHIFMNLPVKGLSAGKGLAFDDSLTLSMTTHAANISTVNSVSLRMQVMSDGQQYGVFPVSLGASNTPTARGTKVIMEKGADISMTGPGYYDPHVQWTQRLTYGGEYLHSAPWNVGNIGSLSTSNGCTNLLPADAQKLFNFLGVGDVVIYPNANGPAMTLGAGYGDWNVPWSQWVTGGALATT